MRSGTSAASPDRTHAHLDIPEVCVRLQMKREEKKKGKKANFVLIYIVLEFLFDGGQVHSLFNNHVIVRSFFRGHWLAKRSCIFVRGNLSPNFHQQIRSSSFPPLSAEQPQQSKQLFRKQKQKQRKNSLFFFWC
jgi:hypothetical protein